MIIQGSSNINSNTQVDDVLVNNILAVSRGYFVVEYSLVASASGLTIDVFVGLNNVAPGLQPSTANRVPIYPDDFVGRFGVIPGDRIVLRARETAGASKTLFYTFRFNPVR